MTEQELPELPPTARRWLEEERTRAVEVFAADELFVRVLSNVGAFSTVESTGTTLADTPKAVAWSSKVALQAKALIFALGALLGGMGGYALRSASTAAVPEAAPASLPSTAAIAPVFADHASNARVTDAPLAVESTRERHEVQPAASKLPPIATHAVPRRNAHALVANSSSRGESESDTSDIEPSGNEPAQDRVLEDERLLLAQARQAIARGQHATALQTLTQHRWQFFEGQLAEERDALFVLALAGAERWREAREARDNFLARYPSSLHARTVRSATRE